MYETDFTENTAYPDVDTLSEFLDLGVVGLPAQISGRGGAKIWTCGHRAGIPDFSSHIDPGAAFPRCPVGRLGRLLPMRLGSGPVSDPGPGEARTMILECRERL